MGRWAFTGAASAFFVPTFLALALVRAKVAPRYLRWFLEWCGGAFGKLGQLLASRFDFLPARYYTELGSILDRMRPLKLAVIERILEAELGARCSEFANIDPTSLGAATIAQVHAATLRDGKVLVLKIMRPGIELRLRADLLCLRSWARLLGALGLFEGADLPALVREVERLTLEELDFRREAFNAERLSLTLASDDIDHCAPRPIWRYCTTRVIALERLLGVPLTEVVVALTRGEEEKLSAWAARGIRPKRLGRILYRSMLEQFYRHRLFHGDPHPGNVIAMDGGSLGYVDFGNMGQLDMATWAKQERIVGALSRGDVHGAYEALLSSLEPLTAFDLQDFEAEVKELYATYLLKVQSAHSTLAERTMGTLFLQVTDAIRRAGLTLPKSLTRLYRAQLLFDVLAFRLHPQLDVVAEYGEFLREERNRRLSTTLRRLAESPEAVFEYVFDRLPRVAAELSDWVLHKLPETGRTYGRALSGLERVVQLSLRYARRTLLAAAAGLTLLKAGPWVGLTVPEALRLPHTLDAFWWLWVLLALSGWYFMRQLDRVVAEAV